MLFKKDEMFGHIIVDTENGVIYEDDGTSVDFANPRPCKKCGLHIGEGEQDPCIANLPCISAACCGHGLVSEEERRPHGYVAFNDGRCLRFCGNEGGERIRAVVNSIIAGEAPPIGFEFDAERMWWEGLSEAQCAYVRSHLTEGLAHLVREATDASELDKRIVQGEIMWYTDLSEEQKNFVLARQKGMLVGLVQRALKSA